MPRISTRKRVLKDLEQCERPALMLIAMQDSSDDEPCNFGPPGSRVPGNMQHVPGKIPIPFFNDSDSDDEGEDVFALLADLHDAVSRTRYLEKRQKIPKSVDFRYQFFLRLPEVDFRAITRLSYDTFFKVADLIKDDPVFHNESDLEHAPISWQLAIALDRLGNDGNGVSADRSKQLWGYGHGTVFSFYRRVLHALNNIRRDWVVWPSSEARQVISAAMAKKGFRGAVGFVDGTTFPLHNKPAYRGHKYMDRKKRYSIGGQVVCDHKYRILHFMTGLPGSVHGSRYFSHSPLVLAPQDHFSPGEFLIADSAYACSLYVVPGYKENQRDDRDSIAEPELIEAFNLHFSRARVVNEHTIGILKARWPSLRQLRLNLRERGDIHGVMLHTVACAVLHNIALDSDPWDLEDVVLDDPDSSATSRAAYQGSAQQSVGQRKRYQVPFDPMATPAASQGDSSRPMHAMDHHLRHWRESLAELQNYLLTQDMALERIRVCLGLERSMSIPGSVETLQRDLIRAGAEIVALQENMSRDGLLYQTALAKDKQIAELREELIKLHKVSDVQKEMLLSAHTSLAMQEEENQQQRTTIFGLESRMAILRKKAYDKGNL